jgi:hypothetical protein
MSRAGEGVFRLDLPVAPKVTSHPSNVTVAAGGAASFTAAASGTPTPTVQWQASTNSGLAWTDVSGARSTSYSVTPTTADNGTRYRAVFTNPSGTATSNAATLTVLSSRIQGRRH